jgi:hypothetical protein
VIAPRRWIALVVMAFAALVVADVAGLEAQRRDAATPRDTSFSALDAVVHDGTLITLERTRCDAARAFEAGECGALIGRSLDDGSIRFRTAVPIRIRGLLQLDLVELADHTTGLLLRAHDRGCLFARTGRLLEQGPMPISTFDAPVWLTPAHGAWVFHERGGCSAYVVGRSDLAHGLYVRGVESHVYARLGEPHDTVCFGFHIDAIGEVPMGRGAARVLVVTTSLHHPTEAGPPTIVAFDRATVAYTTAVGEAGDVIASSSLEGTHAIVVVSHEGEARRVTVDARSGQRLSVARIAPATSAQTADAGPTPDADTAPIAHDRRGIPIPRFARCTVSEGGGRHRVVLDGREVLASERRILVLDQRGDRCVAVELGSGPVEDTVHVIAP